MRSGISSKLIFASCVGYFDRAHYGYIVPYCTILHHIAPYCTILYHIAPYCTILHRGFSLFSSNPNTRSTTACRPAAEAPPEAISWGNEYIRHSCIIFFQVTTRKYALQVCPENQHTSKYILMSIYIYVTVIVCITHGFYSSSSIGRCVQKYRRTSRQLYTQTAVT